MFISAVKNAGLDAVTALLAHLSLHTAFPGGAGSSEVAGGTPAYARKAASWNAASADNADFNGTVTFDIPPATTIAWVGFWSASSGGTYRGYAPLSGGYVPRNFAVDATGNKILANAHGLVADNRVAFFGGTVPGGLTEGTLYWVINPNTDDYQVSATQGGSAIDLTTAGDADVLMSRVVPETFAGQGTYTLNDADINAYP